MAVEIKKEDEKPEPFILNRTLHLTADGRVVEENDVEGVTVLGGAGSTISAEDVAKYKLDDSHRQVEEGAEAEPGSAVETPEPDLSLRGVLADDFPHRQKLVDAGLDTYGKVRAAVRKGDDWYADVSGIGEKTAPSILEALAAKPEEEDEE